MVKQYFFFLNFNKYNKSEFPKTSEIISILATIYYHGNKYTIYYDVYDFSLRRPYPI